MGDALIRPGGPEDVEPAVAVWLAANSARRRRLTPGAEQATRVRARVGDPEAFLLVAEDAGDVVGMALGTQGLADDGAGPVPLQQYRIVQLAPRTRNVALSLNASAIYLGQGIGAGLGALALGYGSLATLGWTGSISILAALAVLLLTNKKERPDVAPKG